MGLHIVVAAKTTMASEEETLLYMGNDGVKAMEAAARAQASGQYVGGRIKRQVIYSWIPCPTVPVHKAAMQSKPEKPIEKITPKSAMKRTFAVVAASLLILGSAISLHAQTSAGTMVPTYGSSSLSLSGIGTTAGGTTTTVTNQIIDCRYFQNITLLTKFNFSAATTSNVVYSIAKSLDRTTFETTPSVTWTVTPSATDSTNHCVATTTIATGGCGYLKLVSIQNTHGSAVLTNELFQYSIKRSAP